MLAQQLVRIPFCSPTGCGVFRVWTPRLPGWQPQRRETSSLKYRLASWRLRLKTVRTKTLLVTVTSQSSPVRVSPAFSWHTERFTGEKWLLSGRQALSSRQSAPDSSSSAFIYTARAARERLVCEFPRFHPSGQ